jgi:hypothetical protein
MKTFFYPFLTVMFFVFTNINNAMAQQVNPKIQEVYGDKTQEILQNEPERVKIFTDLLENRIKIVLEVSVGEDKYPKLSLFSLLNKYNPNLTRDSAFDLNTFNPLKYNLNFFSTKTEVYRIDNTDYLIVIKPQAFK